MMTDGICVTYFGTQFANNDGEKQQITVLSRELLVHSGFRVSDLVEISGLDVAQYNRSLDGYWMNDLQITKAAPRSK